MKRPHDRRVAAPAPSFIVGFYGMNVHGEPEYRWRFGYEWVLVVIVLLTGLQLLWFRRRRWL